MGVREKALLAHRLEKNRTRQREKRLDAEAANAARRRDDENAARAQRLIHDSLLEEWFPQEAWTVRDSASSKGAMMGVGIGAVVRPRDASVNLMLEPMNGKVRVSAVTTKLDSVTGYSYWDGPEVNSAADIGRYIEALEAACTRPT